MINKPRLKPSINRMNKDLRRLCAAGLYSYAEMVSQRGFWAKLNKRKPKHI